MNLADSTKAVVPHPGGTTGRLNGLVAYRLPRGAAWSRGRQLTYGRGVSLSIAVHLLVIGLALRAVHEIPAPPPRDQVLALVLEAPAQPAPSAPSQVQTPEPEPVQTVPPAIPPTPLPVAAPPSPPVESTAPPPDMPVPPAPAERAPLPPIATAVAPQAAMPADLPQRQAVAPPRVLPAPPRKPPPRPAASEPRQTGPEPSTRPPAETQATAPARPAEPPAAAPPQIAQSSPAWLASVSSWLMAHRSYPDLARRRGQEGTVVLRFSVDRDGRVQDVNVVRGSGSEQLDQAAQALVANARLPPFPPEMTLPRQTLTVPIRYQLQ